MIPPIWLSIRLYRAWVPIPLVLLWPLFGFAWAFLNLVLTVTLLSIGAHAGKIGEIWIQTWRFGCGLRGTCFDLKQGEVRLKISIF